MLLYVRFLLLCLLTVYNEIFKSSVELGRNEAVLILSCVVYISIDCARKSFVVLFAFA